MSPICPQRCRCPSSFPTIDFSCEHAPQLVAKIYSEMLSYLRVILFLLKRCGGWECGPRTEMQGIIAFPCDAMVRLPSWMAARAVLSSTG